MAAVMYATRFRCDLCGIEADARPVEVWAPIDQTMPAGWVMVDLRRIEPSGRIFREFCDQCAALPLRDILARIKAGQVNA